MIRYALLATIIAAVTTFCIVVFFRTYGTTVSIISAAITAFIVTSVWGHFKKRQPTFHEKTILILVYWVLTITLLLGPVFLVHRYSLGLAVMLMNTTAYPIMMLIFFRDKFLSVDKREERKDKFQKRSIFIMVMAALFMIAMTFYHGFLKISEILNLS